MSLSTRKSPSRLSPSSRCATLGKAVAGTPKIWLRDAHGYVVVIASPDGEYGA